MIGIIILNYNTWNETINCVKSIEKYHSMEDKRIYIVDNNSPQKMSVEHEIFFKKNQYLKLILHTQNKGYSAGNNVGLKNAIEDNCEYFLICNSDILFEDNTIDKLKNSFGKLEHAAIVGPRIYNMDNKFQKFFCVTKLDYYSKLKLIISHTPLNIFLKKFLNGFYFDNEYFTEAKQVFTVSGCCFMISKSGLNAIYPLDENTFLYNEEFIIGCKIENNKQFAYIIPNTKVIHMHGIATNSISRTSYDHMINSEQYYLKKYLNCNNLQCYIMKKIRQLIFNLTGGK